MVYYNWLAASAAITIIFLFVQNLPPRSSNNNDYLSSMSKLFRNKESLYFIF